MGEIKRGPKRKDRAIAPSSPGIPDPPANLDAGSREHYRRLTGLMAEAGLISLLDFDALSIYLSLWKRWQAAEKKLRIVGMVYKAPNGWQVKSPWLEISTQCQRDMRPYLSMFGLSPAARAKLALPEPDEAGDKWKEPE